MPHKAASSSGPLFIVVGFDDKGRVDAATQFNALPENALREARSRATASGYRKFQVYTIETGEKSELTFQRVK